MELFYLHLNKNIEQRKIGDISRMLILEMWGIGRILF